MRMIRTLHRFLVRQTMPAVAVAYYGKMCAGIADFYLGPLVEEINREFAQGARILDVGTGTGHLPMMLARSNPRHQICGLDISSTCLRSAEARAETAGVSGRVRFVRAEVRDLRDRFDLVVSTCSLHHWRYPVRMLKGMAGLLADAGQLWLMDDFGDVSEDARRAWVQRVEASFAAGLLFRSVFNFESRHLAYREKEIRPLCDQAGLHIAGFRMKDVYFLAKCVPRHR